MLQIIKERLHQKYRTLDFPNVEPALSARYLGRPQLSQVDCADCRKCHDACPTGALLDDVSGKTPNLDMGLCIFCGACARACPKQAIIFTRDYHVAAFRREDLVVKAGHGKDEIHGPKNGKNYSLFRRSLKLRQVSAGGCNACEADCNVLGTPVYDLGRFGIDFVASPRHADGLVVTGPVTANMHKALLDTWDATPEPRILVAVGSCAISGGLFRENQECHHGLSEMDVDVWIPGCPPNPWSILDGLLSLRRAS